MRPLAEAIWRTAPDAEMYNAHPRGKRASVDLSIYLNRVTAGLLRYDLVRLRPGRRTKVVVMLQDKGTPPTPPPGWKSSTTSPATRTSGRPSSSRSDGRRRYSALMPTPRTTAPLLIPFLLVSGCAAWRNGSTPSGVGGVTGRSRRHPTRRRPGHRRHRHRPRPRPPGKWAPPPRAPTAPSPSTKSPPPGG